MIAAWKKEEADIDPSDFAAALAWKCRQLLPTKTSPSLAKHGRDMSTYSLVVAEEGKPKLVREFADIVARRLVRLYKCTPVIVDPLSRDADSYLFYTHHEEGKRFQAVTVESIYRYDLDDPVDRIEAEAEISLLNFDAEKKIEKVLLGLCRTGYLHFGSSYGDETVQIPSPEELVLEWSAKTAEKREEEK